MIRLGDLLDHFLKPLAPINLPKSPTFLGNSFKGTKIYHFSSEVIFGQLLQTFGDIFLVKLVSFTVILARAYLSTYTKRPLFPDRLNIVYQHIQKLLNWLDITCLLEMRQVFTCKQLTITHGPPMYHRLLWQSKFKPWAWLLPVAVLRLHVEDLHAVGWRPAVQ